MAPTVTRTPYFTIDGMPSATPAWECENPLDLLLPAARRHDPLLVPRGHGRLAEPMWDDAAEHVAVVNIWGGVDEEGVAGATLVENFLALKAAWYDLPASADSTRTCVLHLDVTTSYSGPVQVIDFEWTKGAALIRAAFTIYVPAGALELDP